MKIIKRLVSVALVLLILLSGLFFSSHVESNLDGELIHSGNFPQATFGFDKGVLKTTVDFDNVVEILSLDIKFVENFGTYTIYYCVSPYLKSFVPVKNMLINCQISVKDGVTTLGFPIITTGY